MTCRQQTVQMEGDQTSDHCHRDQTKSASCTTISSMCLYIHTTAIKVKFCVATVMGKLTV